jgi:hypothetical protein
MSRVRPYLMFVMYFIIASALIAYLSTLLANESLRGAIEALSPIVAAALGVFLVQRSARLAVSWLLVVGVLLSALIYSATWGAYQLLALESGQSVPFFRLAQTAGWSYTLAFVLSSVAPAICGLLLPRPNNSFKPTPLRGAA